MNRTTMKRLFLGVTALGLVTALAACEEPYREPAPVESPVVEAEAPTAEDSAAPTVAEAPATPDASAPVETLPPDKRSSEETVQPESDTLFY